MTHSKVKIRITRILEGGECPVGHTVGEEFVYPDDRGKICASAMNSIFPAVRVLQFGGSFPLGRESRRGRPLLSGREEPGRLRA